MIAFILVTILALPAEKAGAPDPIRMRNAKLVALLQSVHELTPQKLTDEQLYARIQKLIEPLSIDDTARFAMLSYDMITGPAEAERVDSVYWHAFWAAARKVGARKDEWAVMLLDRIARRADLGGGELMMMNELQDAQRAKKR